MTSRLSMFSAGHSRGRRASVAEVIRHAKVTSSLSRVFTRTKSVPQLSASEPNGLVTGGSTLPATGLQDPNSAANQEFPLLIISPPIAQYPTRDINIELGALGIIFPHSNDGAFATSPPKDAISSWVEFFAQTENDRRRVKPVIEPESVIGTAESTDGMATPLGVATSSMTLMDPDVCSQTSTPKEEEEEVVGMESFEHDLDLKLIGDEVVLRYILDGMGPFEGPRLSLNTQKELKTDPGHDFRPNADADPPAFARTTLPGLQKAVPELRYRKDPKYKEPPSISLITATPQGSIGERHEYFTIPLSSSSPVALLTPHYSRHSHSHATRSQYQPDARGDFMVMQPGINTAYVCGSYDSVFLDSEFVVTRHASSLSLVLTEPTMTHGSEPPPSGPERTNDHPNENTTSPTVFNSLIRKLGVGIYSIFRFGRRAAMEEIKPDEAVDNNSQVEVWPEAESSNKGRRIYPHSTA